MENLENIEENEKESEQIYSEVKSKTYQARLNSKEELK
tara:strand:+ start:236 stop:349 length:114 start_codon:yes stop_codon:yes gene_type:complete